MNRLKQFSWLVLGIALMALSACGGGGGGGGDAPPASGGSNWDQLVWDQNNWS